MRKRKKQFTCVVLLKTLVKSDIKKQHKYKITIIEAFRKFWYMNPTEQEFADTINGLVLFPEILYIMNKRK